MADPFGDNYIIRRLRRGVSAHRRLVSPFIPPEEEEGVKVVQVAGTAKLKLRLKALKPKPVQRVAASAKVKLKGAAEVGITSGLIAWGMNSAGKLGGGYFGGPRFAFPQGVVSLSKTAQFTAADSTVVAVMHDGTLWGWGGNDGGGGAGLGFPERDIEDPSHITGGVALYPEEVVITAKLPWIQRRGPVGPVVPTVSYASTAGQHNAALLPDGRVLAWGGAVRGQLGNGWQNTINRGALEKEAGEYVQFAPFWVLTGPPAQSETGFNEGGMELVSGTPGTESAVWAYDQESDPTWGNGTRANVLKDVKLICATQETTYYVKTNNEVWLNGRPAARTAAALYAEKDTTWDPADTTHLPAGWTVEAIDGTHSGYLLMVGNGSTEKEARFVGNNEEYMAGAGVEASPKTNVREVVTPLTAPETPAKDVVAVAKAEYSIKILKSASKNPNIDGTLWTAGSNAESQQGLGTPQDEPGTPTHAAKYVTEIKSLHEGANTGRKVIAVSSKGQYRGSGRNGADMTMCLLDDHSPRVWGWGWGPADAASIRFLSFGTLGTGTSENSNVPISPLGPLTNIKQISCGPNIMCVLQEPGAPASPTVVTTPGSGSLLVKWALPPGSIGTMPNWREEESWKVNSLGQGAIAGTNYSSGSLAAGVREYEQTGMVPGEYQININAGSTTERPVIKGGGTKTGSGGKVKIDWEEPAKAEPSWFIEWRRAAVWVPKVLQGAIAAPGLSTGSPITSIPVAAYPEDLKGSAFIRITSGAHSQIFQLSKAIKEGDTTIPVLSLKPNFAYPAGSEVEEVKWEDWKRGQAEAPGEARTFTLELTPSEHGLTTEEVEVVVVGAFEGSFKTRSRFVVI